MKKLIISLVIPFLLVIQPVKAEENSKLHEEIIYDILVDRFNIGELALSDQVRLDDPLAYHGGDLLGITKKLDRIKKLGFTAINLSPIMENAVDGYHGYWIEDFFKVEEEFGTMSDLNKLIAEAHKRDIKVILELVTNYVALSHPIVTDPGKEDWFKQNTVERIPSTEWLDNVAVLNQDNDEVENYLIDVAEFWMKETEIDGFKLHDADLSSEVFLENLTKHIHNLNPEFYIVAGISSSGKEINYFKDNPNIQAVENKLMFEKMNEVFVQADTPVSILYDAWVESGEKPSLLFVDNKNTARFSNNYADKGRNALTTWKLTLAYLYTTPGIPVIYQGSELPMYGPGFPENQMLVQFNSTDPDLEEYHHRISSLRQEFPVLSYGDFEHVGSNGGMSLFKRTYEDESMYIAINNDTQARTVVVSDIEPGMQLRGFLGDNLVREKEDGDYHINVTRETAEVYIVEENSGINWLLIGFIVGVFIVFAGFIIYMSRKQKKESNK